MTNLVAESFRTADRKCNRPHPCGMSSTSIVENGTVRVNMASKHKLHRRELANDSNTSKHTFHSNSVWSWVSASTSSSMISPIYLTAVLVYLRCSFVLEQHRPPRFNAARTN